MREGYPGGLGAETEEQGVRSREGGAAAHSGFQPQLCHHFTV